MIDRFCNATTDGVFQKDFCWFIRDNNVTRDFDNGYIFAWFFFSLSNIIMSESKFLLHGQFHRANGWIMNDCLGYIKETKEDAIATCNRLNPNFVISHIEVEDWSKLRKNGQELMPVFIPSSLS